MKNIFLIMIVIGVLLIGTFSFVNIDKSNNKEIKIQKKPFEKDFPELQKKIDYKIDKFYFNKYNQRRVIFEWD